MGENQQSLENKIEGKYWVPFVGLCTMALKKDTELKKLPTIRFYSWLWYQTLSSGTLIYVGFVKSLDYFSK